MTALKDLRKQSACLIPPILFWCIVIVYTSINGSIQGISSIIESSFFITFLHRMNLLFVVSIQGLF